MSRFIQPGVSVGQQFSGATQQQDPYGYPIGYEAADFPPKTTYITVGRYGDADLPPGASARPATIAAPYAANGYNYDPE